MSAAIGLVVTTVDDAAKAREIAHRLVERGLAACVQISPIESVYRWNGKVEEARELRLDIKMKVSDYDAVEAEIRALHPYDTPEIIRIDIAAGWRPYLDWVSG